jgi:hypothetical protein
MRSIFLALALFVATPSFATSLVPFSSALYDVVCNVQNPDAHQDDVGYLYRIEVRQTGLMDQRGDAEATLTVFRSAFLGSEEVQVPLRYEGQMHFDIARETLFGLSGVWDEGDTWLDVSASTDENSEGFIGNFAFQEDFGYDVSCKYDVVK